MRVRSILVTIMAGIVLLAGFVTADQNQNKPVSMQDVTLLEERIANDNLNDKTINSLGRRHRREGWERRHRREGWERRYRRERWERRYRRERWGRERGWLFN